MDLALLAAHLVGDYIFQTDAIAARKLTDARVRAWHCLTYCAAFVPFLLLYAVPLSHAAPFLLWLYATHFVTDSRRWASGDKWAPKPILVDQALHAVALAVLSFCFLSSS